jgi:hypothetical protein
MNSKPNITQIIVFEISLFFSINSIIEKIEIKSIIIEKIPVRVKRMTGKVSMFKQPRSMMVVREKVATA